VLAKPLMANHARGLWGYHGATQAGDELTVQSTGIGGPSAAVVLTELAALGLRRAVRIGTCRALSAELGLGDALVVSEALAEEGSAGGGLAAADPGLTAALAADREPVTVASTDLFYDGGGDDRRRLDGAVAVEMGTATLFAIGARLGVAVGCLLVVRETAGGRLIEDEPLAEAAAGIGRLAAAALGATR
jgi:uridine phosphorylase